MNLNIEAVKSGTTPADEDWEARRPRAVGNFDCACGGSQPARNSPFRTSTGSLIGAGTLDVLGEGEALRGRYGDYKARQ